MCVIMIQGIVLHSEYVAGTISRNVGTRSSQSRIRIRFDRLYIFISTYLHGAEPGVQIKAWEVGIWKDGKVDFCARSLGIEPSTGWLELGTRLVSIDRPHLIKVLLLHNNRFSATLPGGVLSSDFWVRERRGLPRLKCSERAT